MSLVTLWRHPARSPVSGKLDSGALDQLFHAARTHNGWAANRCPGRPFGGGCRTSKNGPDLGQHFAAAHRLRS
jgi:hypothetical protein